MKHLLFNTQQRAAGSAASTNILEEETSGLVKYTSSLTFLTLKSVAGGQFQVQATQVNSWLLGIYWKAPSALKRWIKTHNCCLEGNWSLTFKSPCMTRALLWWRESPFALLLIAWLARQSQAQWKEVIHPRSLSPVPLHILLVRRRGTCNWAFQALYAGHGWTLQSFRMLGPTVASALHQVIYPWQTRHRSVRPSTGHRTGASTVPPEKIDEAPVMGGPSRKSRAESSWGPWRRGWSAPNGF